MQETIVSILTCLAMLAINANATGWSWLFFITGNVYIAFDYVQLVTRRTCLII